MRFATAAVSIPCRDRICGPLCGFAAVALVTRVGCPIGYREIRPRHSEAMIASNVVHHICPGRHMAVDAKSSGRIRLVMMMLGSIKLRRQMALAANGIQVFVRKREAVWIVAIGAGD